MLSIVAFKWGSKYTLEHVRRLRRGLARHLHMPHELVLITDDWHNDRFEGAAHRTIPLWEEMRGAPLCGVRLRAFAPDMADRIGSRFAWIDLDVVITGDVTPIFQRAEPFIALATPQGPLAYNGSLVMMDAGARRGVYDQWTPERYLALGREFASRHGMRGGVVSDEGWMTIQLGTDEATVGKAQGIHYYKRLRGGELPSTATMVVMNGRKYDPSFWHLQVRSPWIREHWGPPIER